MSGVQTAITEWKTPGLIEMHAQLGFGRMFANEQEGGFLSLSIYLNC
jgi:imidazolonepropionase-like amidohydrolase